MKHSVSDDEEDDEFPSSAAKRPRVQSSLPGSSPPPLPSDDEQELEPERDDDNQSGSGEDNDMLNAESEDEAARMTQGVQKLRESKCSTGTVAKSGVIEQVELVNFMCHTNASVKFGPQINFLIGNNGSGKSAVLTGISIALGGNAKATNRAGKSGDLVKNGQAFAICTVHLKNQGSDAFEPSVFGKTIIIERRINKDMGGGYKIRNSENKVVDTKKATLDKILDHFNIQVDNPMTVLTQDQSRQFLANSTPKDKYTFFLRGTQLAQLTEEYEVIRSNTEQMEEALNRKKDVIPELKEAYKRAKTRAAEATAAVNQKEKVDQLKKELAWSYVVEVEDKLKLGTNIVDAETAKGRKITEQLETQTQAANAARDEVAEIEVAMQEYQDETRDNKIAELTAQIKDKTAEVKDANGTYRTASNNLKRLDQTIETLTASIAEEKAKLECGTDSERNAISEEIAKLEDEKNKVAIEAGRARNDGAEAEAEYERLKGTLNSVGDELHAAQEHATQRRGRIQQLNQSKTNSLMNFGQGVPKLAELIRREQWIRPPVGPLGTFVELKDPKYSSVLESFFNQTLNAYIVTNEQDKAKLAHLQKQAGSRSPIIKQAEDPTFDCSSGEPNPDVLTIRRVLQFKNDMVYKALVDSLQIEKAAIVEQRAQGDAFMRSNPWNVSACYSADRFKLGGDGQSSSTTAMDAWRGTNRLNPDVAGQIQAVQEELNVINGDVAALTQKKNDINTRMTELHQNVKKCQDRKHRASQKLVQINNRIEALTDKLNEEEPTNLAALQDVLEDNVNERRTLTAQLEALADATRAKMQAAKPLQLAKEALEAENKEATKKIRQLNNMLERRAKDAQNADDALKNLEKKMNEHVEKLAQYESAVEEYRATLEERIEQASTICPRQDVEKKKSAIKLKQEIAVLEKALKDREKRQGASVEQIMAEVLTRRNAAEQAVNTCKELGALIAALEKAYNQRVSRWTDFRDSIASRAKMQFLFHLSNRGFTGKLAFDHDKMKLNLRVQTDDLEGGSTQNRQKDAKSLSGGEKSFSTICLLLTMWESVGCPIRCLDEFDVFMDSVNRLISMKMMTDTAKAAESTQFILITPQSVNGTGFRWGPEVRVIKMSDPERNQGTLQMGNR